MIELRELSVTDGMDIYNMLQVIPADENGFINGCFGITYDGFQYWLTKKVDEANGVNMAAGRVPQTFYWLYVDNVPVGMAKLRHYLNDSLLVEGGHFGYAIIPTERNKGYGKIMLGLVKSEAADMGIDRLLLTIHNDNPASIKVALSCGGVVEKVANDRHYIWIDC